MSRFKPHDPDQLLLLPPSLADWLPRNHLAYFVRDMANELDLESIYEAYEGLIGRPAYAPRMLVAVWIYGYLRGIRSSRRVERALHEDVGFRVLSGNVQPDHWTLNNFRTRHRKALAGLLVKTVRIAQKSGLVKMGQVAVDGTVIQANASKHSAMSYGRMQEEERRLQAEIDKYLAECDDVDRDEDEEFGDRRGDELPPSLAEESKRLAAIKKAKLELEEEARERAKTEQDARRKKAEEEGREFKPRIDPEQAEPEPKAQRNFTDPESRIMVKSGQVIQGYNAQIAVDAASQIIVAADLTNQASDNLHLVSMVKQVEENTGDLPREVSADAGYFSEANVASIEAMLVDALIPPDRQKHSVWRAAVSPVGRPPNNMTTAERMRRLLNTKSGRLRYKLRRCSVEPVFGQIKECRGLRRFLHRGLDKVHDIWLFECAVHNIAKLFTARLTFECQAGKKAASRLIESVAAAARSILGDLVAGLTLGRRSFHTGC